MIKKLFATLFIIAFGISVVSAAEPKGEEISSGKVAAVTGNTAKIEISGDVASWIKKGAYVRAVTEKGTLVLRGAKVLNVEGKVLTIQSAMAKELKAGESYKLSKGRPTAGC